MSILVLLVLLCLLYREDLLAVPDFRHGYFLNCTKVMLSWNHPWLDICVHQGTMPRNNAAACVVSKMFNTHDYLKIKCNYMQDNQGSCSSLVEF